MHNRRPKPASNPVFERIMRQGSPESASKPPVLNAAAHTPPVPLDFVRPVSYNQYDKVDNFHDSLMGMSSSNPHQTERGALGCKLPGDGRMNNIPENGRGTRYKAWGECIVWNRSCARTAYMALTAVAASRKAGVNRM